jgi:hypothetical protein
METQFTIGNTVDAILLFVVVAAKRLLVFLVDVVMIVVVVEVTRGEDDDDDDMLVEKDVLLSLFVEIDEVDDDGCEDVDGIEFVVVDDDCVYFVKKTVF